MQTPPTPLDAKEVFNRVADMVFLVRSARNREAPKLSYGTGFLIDTTGLIVTNFHVVRSVVQHPERYKLFVDGKGWSLEARILALDAVRDLALVKVERSFPAALTMNAEIPARGEKLFSVGQPEDLNTSVVEGTFNGTLWWGVSETMLLSSALNRGMSGGPTFNTRGEVVGVNFAIQLKAQNLSFVLPVRLLAPVMKQAAMRREPTSKKQWRDEIAGQLRESGGAMTDRWLAGKRKVRLGPWTLLAPPPEARCWRRQENLMARKFEVDWQACRPFFSVEPEDGVHSGTYTIDYLLVQNSKVASLPYIFGYQRVYEGSEKKSLKEFENGTSRRGSYTKKRCDELLVVNGHGVPLRVSYCLTGLKRYSGVLDGLVRLATVGKTKDQMIVDLKLMGFTRESLEKLVGEMVESVGRS